MSQEILNERRPLISANWKMNLNHFEALKFVQELSYEVSRKDVDAVDVSIHPPFTDLRTVQTTLQSDKIPFFLGAQNCHFKASGAFTGEIAPGMLAKLDVNYVIVGHSERRTLFDEDDQTVNKKVKAVLAAEMTPILCVGEQLEERDEGKASDVVTAQLVAGLKGLSAEQVASIVIAYEPIWAIGTGQTASSDDAQEMCHHIRSKIADLYDLETSEALRIQYGGSVKPTNIAEIMSQPDIDGALVGGASLKVADFKKIIQYRLHDL